MSLNSRLYRLMASALRSTGEASAFLGAVEPLASPGASGQVLTSAGAGALPAWQTPAADTDVKAKVSSNDTTAGFLNGKLVQGSGITLTENNDGGDETLTVAAAGGSPGGADKQVQFNDGGTAFGGNAGLAYNPDWNALSQGMDCQALGDNSRAAGYLTRATCSNCVASGSGSVAGYVLRDCLVSGVTVTVTGGDYTNDYYPGTLLLSGLAGGSGPAVARGQVTGVAFSGGNTVLTLAAPVTSHSTGGAGMLDYGNSACAEGLGTVAVATGAHSEGVGTTASGQGGHAEGNGSTASGIASHAEGSAIASGVVSHAEGTANASLLGQHAFSSGFFSTPGDGQGSRLVLLGRTANTAPLTLLLGGAGGDRLTVRPGFTYNFYLRITARKTDGTKHAKFCREGIVHNEAGTTSLEGAVQTVGTDTNTPGWAVAITADDSTDSLQVQVTGEATVRWQATVWLGEVGS